MVPKMKATITYQSFPEFSERAVNAAVKVAALEAGRYWMDHYLNPHFTLAAYPRYNVPRRATPSAAIRRRNPEAINPLVSTGRMKKMAQQLSVPRSTATKVTIDIQVPEYANINFRGKGPLSDELGIINFQELEKLSEVFHDYMAMALIAIESARPDGKSETLAPSRTA